ncbi:ATPase [Betaproteobacteria bacterium]|nr:ATPase [Betaproteobacteria bacterium]
MNTASPAFAFEKQLADLLRARFPCLYIPTWEESRLIDLIRDVAGNADLIRTPRKVYEWSLTQGVVENGKAAGEETKAALKVLDFIGASKEAALFILKDFHIFFGVSHRPHDPQIVRRIRDLIPGLKQSQPPKNVIFVSPQLTLPDDLEKDVTIVEFALPTAAEIRAVLDEMIETNRHSGRVRIQLSGDEKELLAKAAQGLTLKEAENAFARAMVEDGKFDISKVETILEEKRQIIRKSGILECIKSDLDIDDVGGLQNLKRWLIRRNKVWLDAAARYRLPAPKGVLITGVPGCGKSLVAKAVAAMWQLPLLRLDVGKIFAGLVGSSEENMRRAIQTAEAIAPCVLWIDEIEKGFGGMAGGGSNDSGTSARIFATFLTWMQEKTRPVFVVATANNIAALPPEMLRKGRFDEIFFVDLPTRNERRDILKLHLERRLTDPQVKGDLSINDLMLDHLSGLTEGFVGAELESTVIGGLFEAFYEDRAVRPDDFVRAIKQTVPLSITQAEQIRSLRQWANARAVAATPAEDRADYAAAASDTPATPPAPEDLLGSRGGRSIDF